MAISSEMLSKALESVPVDSIWQSQALRIVSRRVGHESACEFRGSIADFSVHPGQRLSNFSGFRLWIL